MSRNGILLIFASSESARFWLALTKSEPIASKTEEYDSISLLNSLNGSFTFSKAKFRWNKLGGVKELTQGNRI